METQIGLIIKENAARLAIKGISEATVASREDHALVAAMIDDIRTIEKDLESEWQSLPIVQEYKRIQKLKASLANDLEAARKSAKSRLLAYEDKIEAERLAAERIAQAEAKRLAEEATLQDAVEAEKLGNKEQAEAILAEPVVAATIVVPQEQLKAKGHTRRRVWKSKIVDASKIPADYMTPDLDKISATVRAWKRDGEVIPGVMAWSEVV